MDVAKKILKGFGMILLILIFLVVMVSSSIALGFAYVRATNLQEDLSDFGIGEIISPKEPKKSINVLVLGCNQNLSDFIMVARYNPENGKISLLSIPRDTKYNGLNGSNTAYSKINAIYQGSHIDRVIEKVEKMLDIKIDKYIVFDKQALWEVVDAIGGVTVDIGDKNLKYSDPEQDLYIDLKAGIQKLTGKQAEQYVRYRKGYYDGDLGRIKAQQNFIMAFIKECIKPANVLKLPNAAKVGLEYVKTDVDLDLILYYLEDIATIDLNKVGINMLPGYPQTLDGVSFYIYDEKETKQLSDEMFKDIIPETEDNNKVSEN